MITRRAHAISLIAVFLALAVGVVLGSGLLSGEVVTVLRGERAQLQENVDRLTAETADLQAQLDRADAFDGAMAERVVRGALSGRTVVVLAAPDADPESLTAIESIIGTAGGAVTGRVTLTQDALSTANGDDLRTRATSVVPQGVQLQTAAVDQGSIAGDLLGATLLRDPGTGQPRAAGADVELVLGALRSAGYLQVEGLPEAADLAVVVSGPSADGNAGALLARFTTALRPRGAGAVLAGPVAAAEGSGPIATVRADTADSAVSTVDGVDRHAGQIALVLALAEQSAGGSGQYGLSTGAAAFAAG
ncbi:copper transporter [Millisia brevis]|uniref:copper transporter n=1 Tax=Millisia brevis TaxID=264148 RepID=UPI0008312CF4|nr:copper transporter [Millisia brevis]